MNALVNSIEFTTDLGYTLSFSLEIDGLIDVVATHLGSDGDRIFSLTLGEAAVLGRFLLKKVGDQRKEDREACEGTPSPTDWVC